MNGVNYNILAWYSAKKYQHHRQWWAYDAKAPLSVLVNQIPPFQLVRDRTNNPITEFVIVDFSTGTEGTETDVLSAINTAGLSVEQPTGKDYDLIKYPSTIPIITSPMFSKGLYYCRMSDGVNTWYSELFTMCNNVDGLIKIEYCHGENFEYINGRIEYTNNFVNYLYLPGEVARPKYEYEEEADPRNGESFFVKQTSWKLHTISPLFLPEYLIDAMRLIRLHDNVTITYNGITHTVNEFIFDPGEWVGNGALAKTDIEFKTNLVTVNIVGRGSSSSTCEPTGGDCLTITYNPVAEIDEGSAEYTGQYYINSLGVQTAFAENDYILIKETGGSIVLYQFISSAYSAASTSGGQNAYIADTETYYQRNAIVNNWIKTVMSYEIVGLNWRVSFNSIPGTIAEFYFVGEEGETLQAIETVDTINTPIDFPVTPGVTHIKMKIYNATCGHFQTAIIEVAQIEPEATVIGTDSGFVIGTDDGTVLGILK